MKKKIIDLLKKAYANEFFNVFSVALALILGLVQQWPGIVFVGSYLAGAATVSMNKVKPVVNNVKKVK